MDVNEIDRGLTLSTPGDDRLSCPSDVGILSIWGRHRGHPHEIQRSGAFLSLHSTTCSCRFVVQCLLPLAAFLIIYIALAKGNHTTSSSRCIPPPPPPPLFHDELCRGCSGTRFRIWTVSLRAFGKSVDLHYFSRGEFSRRTSRCRRYNGV